MSSFWRALIHVNELMLLIRILSLGGHLGEKILMYIPQ